MSMTSKKNSYLLIFFQKLVDFYLIIGYNKFTLKQEM